MEETSVNLELAVKYGCEMQDARRNMLNEIIKFKTYYAALNLNYWNGLHRRVFHKLMFGEDGQSGYVGEVFNICNKMNDILYEEVSKYVSKIARIAGVEQYSNPDNVIKSNVPYDPNKINSIDGWIEYSQIEPTIIKSNFEREEELAGNLRMIVFSIIGYKDDFSRALSNCKVYAIIDGSLDGLYNSFSNLQKKLNDLHDQILKSVFTLIETSDEFRNATTEARTDNIGGNSTSGGSSNYNASIENEEVFIDMVN